MSSRQFSLWQKAVALAPVLLLLVYLPAETMMRCRMDGLLRPSCCCPPKAAPAPSGPAVKAADCCNPEIAQSTRPAAEAVRPADHDPVQIGAVSVAASFACLALTSPVERPAPAWQRHGPGHEGLPLVLLKHAFLI